MRSDRVQFVRLPIVEWVKLMAVLLVYGVAFVRYVESVRSDVLVVGARVGMIEPRLGKIEAGVGDLGRSVGRLEGQWAGSN